MKYIRILSIVSFLISIIFLSWNCNDSEMENSNIPTNNSTNSVINPEIPIDGLK